MRKICDDAEGLNDDHEKLLTIEEDKNEELDSV